MAGRDFVHHQVTCRSLEEQLQVQLSPTRPLVRTTFEVSFFFHFREKVRKDILRRENKNSEKKGSGFSDSVSVFHCPSSDWCAPRLSSRCRQRERSAVPRLCLVQRGAYSPRFSQSSPEAAQRRQLQETEHQENRLITGKTPSSS